MPGAEVDHYEVLGLVRAADASAVREAYRTLVKRYHPDVGGDESSAEMMVALNEAYAVLGDPAARADYDRQLGVRAARIVDARQDGVLYVDEVIEKIDTGRARRKLATLNREFVRMESDGWEVEFRHDHLVCTRTEYSFWPPRRIGTRKRCVTISISPNGDAIATEQPA